MDYLDILAEEMSFEERVCEAEFRAECERENKQLKYLEEKENVNG